MHICSRTTQRAKLMARALPSKTEGHGPWQVRKRVSSVTTGRGCTNLPPFSSAETVKWRNTELQAKKVITLAEASGHDQFHPMRHLKDALNSRLRKKPNLPWARIPSARSHHWRRLPTSSFSRYDMQIGRNARYMFPFGSGLGRRLFIWGVGSTADGTSC